MRAYRMTQASLPSIWLCQIDRTNCASSDSRLRDDGGKWASAACQRSSAASGETRTDGNSVCVNSSDRASKVCASGSRSVLRRAENNFFSNKNKHKTTNKTKKQTQTNSNKPEYESGGIMSSQADNGV